MGFADLHLPSSDLPLGTVWICKRSGYGLQASERPVSGAKRLLGFQLLLALMCNHSTLKYNLIPVLFVFKNGLSYFINAED